MKKLKITLFILLCIFTVTLLVVMIHLFSNFTDNKTLELIILGTAGLVLGYSLGSIYTTLFKKK